MIEIDGRSGEGGGQMLRTALAMSMLTQTSFSMVNIRAGRAKPGLQPQHLAAVSAAQELSGATVEGAKLHSQKIVFHPRSIKARTLSVDIGTAGSATLLLQALLPAALLSGKKCRFRIKGGSDVPFAPPADYFVNVLLPHLRRFATFDVSVTRGFYPAGGGLIDLKVTPLYERGTESLATFLSQHQIPVFDLTKLPPLLSVKGSSVASTALSTVADRQAQAARGSLSSLSVPITITPYYAATESPGSVITLWALCGEEETSHVNPVILGGSCLGEKGKPSEEVGRQAAAQLKGHLSAPVDPFLADQLVPYLALAGGSYKTSSVTQHTHSNVSVVNFFLENRVEVTDTLITARRA